jgi:uncharacterized integral membrane protein
MIIRFKLIVGLLSLLLFIVFTVQNIAAVTVRFITIQFEASLSLILFLTFLLGMATSLLLSAVVQLSKHRNSNEEPKNIYRNGAL